MLFHDGELEEPRASEVAAWLGADAGRTGRAKLTAMGLVGEAVRSRVAERSQGFDVADAVMRAIEASAEHAPREATEEPPERLAPVVPLSGVRSGARSGARPAREAPKRRRSDDHLWRAVGLATAAVAAAAAWAVWPRATTTDLPIATVSPRPLPTMVISLADPVESPAATTRPSAEPMALAAADDVGQGVQVGGVDFGARMGSIFYVARDSDPGLVTTVVWIREEEP